MNFKNSSMLEEIFTVPTKMTILWKKLFTQKSQVPDCNTLAYRKGKYEARWNIC